MEPLPRGTFAVKNNVAAIAGTITGAVLGGPVGAAAGFVVGGLMDLYYVRIYK